MCYPLKDKLCNVMNKNFFPNVERKESLNFFILFAWFDGGFNLKNIEILWLQKTLKIVELYCFWLDLGLGMEVWKTQFIRDVFLESLGGRFKIWLVIQGTIVTRTGKKTTASSNWTHIFYNIFQHQNNTELRLNNFLSVILECY